MKILGKFALAGLAAAVPVVLALLFAFLQSLNHQRDRAAILAEEVEQRASTTSTQLLAGFTALAEIAPEQACSTDGIIRMREVALSAPYLAGLGFIANSALQCSSFGNLPAALVLGPADYITANGYAIREGRELAITPGARVVLLSAPNGFTGFYHPAMVMGLDGDVADLSLGVVSTSTRRPQMSFGPALDWDGYPIPAPGESEVTNAGGRIIAIARPVQWDQFAYVAIPFSSVTADFQDRLWLFLLFGFLAAIPTFFVVQQLFGPETPEPAAHERATLPA